GGAVGGKSGWSTSFRHYRRRRAVRPPKSAVSGPVFGWVGLADNRPMSDPRPQKAPTDPTNARFLAIETSTDCLSLALGSGVPGAPLWQHTGTGGAQASTDLLPAVQGLLA
ncbi:hypothetical protein RZS08_59110, partial [Arthrospira platensis SPKY1]|nr:hypothetical protein [Arthrospira platensis SPKY1]